MISQKSNLEAYQQFLQFVQKVNQTERTATNRKMKRVFFWCFVIPSVLSIAVLVLVSFQAIPRIAKSYLDWLILFFPVSYSLYFLGTEVLRGVPRVIRGGGLTNVLDQALQEGAWREKVCEQMESEVNVTPAQWSWIRQSFQTDLQRLLDRNRFITILAGAVFFLIMEGIDAISGPAEGVAMVRSANFGLIELSRTNFSQYVGLSLFLILLYLSGNQSYHLLRRYLDCAELVTQKKHEANTEI